MSGLWKRFDRLWFTPAPASSLAAMRIASGLYAFYYLCTRYSMMLDLAGGNETLFEPVGLARFLTAPLEAGTFEAVLTLTLLLNVAFILGLLHRVSGPAFAFFLMGVLCYRNSWGMIYHMHNLLVLHVAILGMTRSADQWSFDCLYRWAAPKFWSGLPRYRRFDDHWQYGWPIRLACAATAAAYFLAGAAKLFGETGFNWITGSVIRSQIAVDAIRKDLLGSESSELAAMIYDHVWLFTLFGVGALLLELGAPLVLLDKRSSRMWAVMAFLFHWGIFFVMGIRFRYQLCGAAFVSLLVSHSRTTSCDEEVTP